jgi:flagellin-specific chaperone FliS
MIMSEPQVRRASEAGISRHTGPKGHVAVGADSTVPAQYELLLGKLELAEAELRAGHIGGRSGHLEEASGIVFDLLYSLDFKQGGELVPRLAALYGYMGNELLNVGRTGDRVQLGHLRDMITTLKQSW